MVIDVFEVLVLSLTPSLQILHKYSVSLYPFRHLLVNFSSRRMIQITSRFYSRHTGIFFILYIIRYSFILVSRLDIDLISKGTVFHIVVKLELSRIVVHGLPQ